MANNLLRSLALVGAVAFIPATTASLAQVDVNSYRERVEVYRAFVEGRGDFFAGELPPDDRAALDDVSARQRAVGAVLTRQNFVVLLPTVDREAAQLYVVLGGRLAPLDGVAGPIAAFA